MDQREIEEHILPGVEQQVENLPAEECAEIAVTASQEGIRSKARALLATVVLPPREEGARFFEARRSGTGALVPVREIGAQTLFVLDLSEEDRASIRKDWKPNWLDANSRWRSVGSMKLWRCGGAAFGIGDAGSKGPMGSRDK